MLTPDDKSARLAKNFKGYDISPDMVRLSLVNLYQHGFTDPHIFEHDTRTIGRSGRLAVLHQSKPADPICNG